MDSYLDLLIIGNASPFHLGAHFLRAAQDLKLNAELIDVKLAESSSRWMNRLYWHFRAHRMPRENDFCKKILDNAKKNKPKLILVLGICPVNRRTVKNLRAMGSRLVNFLSDDPFNRIHTAPWFIESLSEYDSLYTPRHSNLLELKSITQGTVHYLRFGYCPHVHFPVSNLSLEDKSKYACDIMFAGGADPDRLPFIKALISAGFKVKLYGGYWDKFKETETFSMGNVSLEELRKAVQGARLCLNLVRKANRDDHVMRTFELPAMMATVLSEDTPEHRSIFGEHAMLYFNSIEQMVKIAKDYLSGQSPAINTRKVLSLVQENKHRYQDRLLEIMQTA